MNNIQLLGRITADVELKSTQSGVEVCSFTLAVKRPKVKDTTDFINCVAWRNTAKFITDYFKKGQMIAVDGTLTSRNYEDKNKNKRVAFEVVVDNAYFCQGKSDSNSEANNEPNFEEVNTDEGLPF